MLEYFKSDILHTFSLQMKRLEIKKKQVEVERKLTIFFHRCTKSHPRIEICSMIEENHSNDRCLCLLGLEVMYQGAREDVE